MKQIGELVKIVEHRDDCVVLEFVGSELDFITFGCFDGTEKYYRIEKRGGDNYMTTWFKNGKGPFTWHSGISGSTCVTNDVWDKYRILRKYVNETLGTNF